MFITHAEIGKHQKAPREPVPLGGTQTRGRPTEERGWLHPQATARRAVPKSGGSPEGTRSQSNRWFFNDVALWAALLRDRSKYLKHSNPGDPTHGSFTGGTLQHHNSPAAHVKPPLSSMTVLFDLFSPICPQIRRKYQTPRTFFFFLIQCIFCTSRLTLWLLKWSAYF